MTSDDASTAMLPPLTDAHSEPLYVMSAATGLLVAMLKIANTESTANSAIVLHSTAFNLP